MTMLAAAATAYSMYQRSQAAKTNAQIAGNEANIAGNQANAQVNQLERTNRERLGMQSAAFGGAGVGYGGSSAQAMRQSAINQELDALNTRYKGQITGYGYREESSLENQQGNTDRLLAGAALLKGIGTSSYVNWGPGGTFGDSLGPGYTGAGT